ncbi:MAG: hypothetical protein JO290_14050, partial [Sphingomonadaceae bacterium]|nr:hypothetical protein [Sphingomonadaceae bacterium]
MADSRTLALTVKLALIAKVVEPLKSIERRAEEMRLKLKTARIELRDLEKVAGDVATFKELQAQVGKTLQAFGAATEKARALEKQIAATANPTKTLVREFDRATKKANGLAGEYRRQVADLDRLKGSLGAAGIAVRALAADEGTLKTKIEAASAAYKRQQAAFAAVRARAQVKAQRERLTNDLNGAQMNLFYGGAPTLAGGVGIGLGLKSAIDEATQLQTLMTNVQLNVKGQADANGKAFDPVQRGRDITALAERVGQLPLDMAKSLDTLAAYGAPLKSLFG